MMILGQIEGAAHALDAAAKTGYESVVVVVVLLAFISGLTFIVKWILNSTSEREKRLSDRVSRLEDFIENTLVKMVASCEVALEKVIISIDNQASVLNRKSCLLENDHQVKIIDTIADVVADRVVSTIHAAVKKHEG